MSQPNIEIFKATFELLIICFDILLEEQQENLEFKLSETERQYRRLVIENAKAFSHFDNRDYPQ